MAQHFVVPVATPVYSLGWTSDSTFVLGGGGGSSKTGIKNRLALCHINLAAKSVEKVDEYELPRAEDAPMSMAVHLAKKEFVCGINSSQEKIATGVNENLRVFAFTEDQLKFESAKQTINNVDAAHYQKSTNFSRDGSLLAVGTTSSQFSLFSYPDLEKVFPCTALDGDEIWDTDFNDKGDMVLATSSKKLCVWSTKATKGEKVGAESSAELVQTIERPVLKKEMACTFRAARFGRNETSEFLYTIVNTSADGVSGRRRGARAADRKAYITIWDTKTWTQVKTRSIGNRPVTCFDVSQTGKLLAVASSDLSVTVLDAHTLRPLLSILHAHDFPATCLRFNPAGTVLASGSADNTVRIIRVGTFAPSSRRSTILAILFSILILLIGLVLEVTFGEELRTMARQHLHF